MKTHKKLTESEIKLLHSKQSINFNHRIINDILNFVYDKIHDIDILTSIYEVIEPFIDNLDTIISKSLTDHETDNKKDAN